MREEESKLDFRSGHGNLSPYEKEVWSYFSIIWRGRWEGPNGSATHGIVKIRNKHTRPGWLTVTDGVDSCTPGRLIKPKHDPPLYKANKAGMLSIWLTHTKNRDQLKRRNQKSSGGYRRSREIRAICFAHFETHRDSVTYPIIQS